MRRSLLGFVVMGFALLAACSSGRSIDSDDERDDSGPGRKPDAGRDGGDVARDGGTSGSPDAAGPDEDDAPLSAPDRTWTFVEFRNTQCRDGSAAGVAVSLNRASDKLMIFLDGGGACFDTLTCAGNPANVSAQVGERKTGVFDRTRSENPVKDWNVVFVPYCTGDVHGGTNADGVVDGVPQKFVGRLNLEKFLRRIVPTFAGSSQVLLTGSSAGGFGAALNFELVQDAFGDVPVTAIDDSGPPMSSEFVPACLQERWRTTWGFDASFLADCGADCPDRNDYSIDYMKHLAAKYPGRASGLIATTGDSVITLFYGFGSNDCMSLFPLPLSAQRFTEGLLDFRATAMELGNFATYYAEGTGHTFLRDDIFYDQASPDGIKLVDWFRDVIDGEAAAHVGP